MIDIHEHLMSRHLDISRYNGIMTYDDVVIFPLWNLSGIFCGYQQYRPGADKKKKNDPREGRYYTSIHGNKGEKPLAVWGLESYDYRRDILVIVEGIFDAVRLHNNDIPAVALLTSSHLHFRNWLLSTGRKIYKVEDHHGSRLGPYASLSLPVDRNDLGECSEDEVQQVINQITL